MKAKYIGVILLVFCIILIFLANFTNKGMKDGETDSEFIRIHIRANSNASNDQNVKYAVKDAIVEYLTPVVAGSKNRADVYSRIAAVLPALEREADKVLRRSGFEYGARAKMTAEEFPHRVYQETVLEGGVYDALVMELGGGAGDNWWCVVYPPLCFVDAKGTGADGISYKSKIAELIRSFGG